MPDPTMADLIGQQIEGYVVVGMRNGYKEVAAGGAVFDSADDARDEADFFQHVSALVRLPEDK